MESGLYGPETSYRQRHKWLGPASLNPCELRLSENCRGVAREWALDWRKVAEENLRRDARGWFSVGLDDDYAPACRSCHRRLDDQFPERYIRRSQGG